MDQSHEIYLNQYEIRYAPILNFAIDVRPIISKYLSFFDNYNITEYGSLKESFDLRSLNEGFNILIKVDRIILRFDGDLNEVNDKNSTPLKIFFKIFSDISSSSTFISVKNHLYFILGFRLNDDTFEVHSNNFLQKHIGDGAFRFDLNEPIDGMVKLEYKNGDNIKSYSYGPYAGITDIKDRSFEVLNSDYSKLLTQKKGVMIELIHVGKVTNLNIDDFIVKNREIINILEKFWNEY